MARCRHGHGAWGLSLLPAASPLQTSRSGPLAFPAPGAGTCGASTGLLRRVRLWGREEEEGLVMVHRAGLAWPRVGDRHIAGTAASDGGASAPLLENRMHFV